MGRDLILLIHGHAPTAVAVLPLVAAPLALTLTPLAHGTQLIYVGIIPTVVACVHGYRFALASPSPQLSSSQGLSGPTRIRSVRPS